MAGVRAAALLSRSVHNDGRPWSTCGFQVPGVIDWLAVLSFFPVALALAQGQDTAVLVLGAACWSVLIRQRRDFTAGVLLSLVTIRPHIALTLAIPFVFARRRVFAGFLAGAVLLGLYSLSLVGCRGCSHTST